MLPTANSQWRINGFSGFDSIVLKDGTVPPIGDLDVLVRWKYASLNYRDLVISKNTYPLGANDGVVVGSDGAGEVIRVEEAVKLFKPGDRVTGIHLQTWQSGPLKAEDIDMALGGKLDGVLQEYGVLPERGLIKVPETLNFQQSSTLAIVAVTAWNGLCGLRSKSLKPGQWVLTQGSGGVSIFALQVCVDQKQLTSFAPGKEKAELLKGLGADYIINYREVPNWGEEAKRNTGSVGVDHIIEVGGLGTLRQSLNAIKGEGVISLIGFMVDDAKDDVPKLLEALYHACIVRGVLVASKKQFEEMNAFIDANNIKPVIDPKVFEFAELRSAYQYMWDQKHFGKVTIKIAS
ncbi:chaperonin 10-like protein [Xylogone sp. PMI_703]|nr:chaperonin 10-like protein [Xylogone sp. PMI_703]